MRHIRQQGNVQMRALLRCTRLMISCDQLVLLIPEGITHLQFGYYFSNVLGPQLLHLSRPQLARSVCLTALSQCRQLLTLEIDGEAVFPVAALSELRALHTLGLRLAPLQDVEGLAQRIRFLSLNYSLRHLTLRSPRKIVLNSPLQFVASAEAQRLRGEQPQRALMQVDKGDRYDPTVPIATNTEWLGSLADELAGTEVISRSQEEWDEALAIQMEAQREWKQARTRASCVMLTRQHLQR